MIGYGWIEILGFISGFVGLSVSVPQIVKIIKSKSSSGVNLTMWVFMMVSYASWFSYGLRVNSTSQIFTNILALSLSTILVFLIAYRKNFSKLFAATIILSLTVASTALIAVLPYSIMSMVLIGFGLTRIFQIKESFINFKNTVKTSVSLTTHYMITLASIGWTIYGWVTGLWVNVISSILLILFSLVIVAFESANKANSK
jgi:uncharacterized protein with PQ loop repeat